MSSNNGDNHWLVRRETIRWMSLSGITLLILTIVLQLVIEVKGYFEVDGWFGFGGVFGFSACVAMVLFAKGLGRWLKREESFYDD